MSKLAKDACVLGGEILQRWERRMQCVFSFVMGVDIQRNEEQQYSWILEGQSRTLKRIEFMPDTWQYFFKTFQWSWWDASRNIRTIFHGSVFGLYWVNQSPKVKSNYQDSYKVKEKNGESKICTLIWRIGLLSNLHRGGPCNPHSEGCQEVGGSLAQQKQQLMNVIVIFSFACPLVLQTCQFPKNKGFLGGGFHQSHCPVMASNGVCTLA